MRSRFKRFIKNVWKIIMRPEMKVLPGQLAFFFVLSVVPIITLIGYLSSWFGLSMDLIVNFLSTSFSKETANLIVPIIQGKAMDFNIVTVIALSYWIASNGAHSIIVASNTIYGIENSTFIRRRIKSLFITLFLVLLFLFILVVPVFGDSILTFISSINPNTNIVIYLQKIYPYISAPVTLFTIFLFIKIIYTMAPDKKTYSATVNKGALFTTVFWFLITTAYTYYTHNLANYDLFYGGLSNIVVLMLWLYFLAYIFVIGLAFNHGQEQNRENSKQEIK